MPPPAESWEDSEHYNKNIQQTLSGFNFDQSPQPRAREIYHARYEDELAAKRPATLADDLLRLKTNLERAMGIEPSPRTIIRPDDVVQSIETDDQAPVYRVQRRIISPIDDLPIVKARVQHTADVEGSLPATIQEDMAESKEKEITVDPILDAKPDVQRRTTSVHASREGTADIVKSKFEALGMFSRDATPSTPKKNSQAEAAAGRCKSQDDAHHEAELEDEVSLKLGAVGMVVSEGAVDYETSNEAGGVKVTSARVEELEDTYVEDPQAGFLQSKLEAMGVISRRPPPVFSSSRSASSSSTMGIKEEDADDIYDEFLQSKLEAMGVIAPRQSQGSPDPNLLTLDIMAKPMSEAEFNPTSPPVIVVEASDTTSPGDGDPPLSDAPSPAAVTFSGTEHNLDGAALLNIPSRQSSEGMSADETPSLTRESSFSTSDDEPVVEFRKVSIVEIRAAELIHPLSQYDNYERPLPISKERTAVKEFQEMIDHEHNAEHAGHSFIEIDMNDFLIYLPENSQNHPYEMTGLQNIFQTGHREYLIDGILSFDGEDKRYVEGIPFEVLSIGSYGKDHQEITGVWIQTRINSKSDVYYRLRKPHSAYERFHTGFMWLANLSKNFLDYALDTIEADKKVSIHNFRRDFYDWCVVEHGNEEPFKKWYAEYGNPDFRTAIAANIDWLAKEAIGSYRLDDLDVWAEVKYLTKLPFQDVQEHRTIVTPFVYECFKEMSFGRFLKKVDPNADTDFRRKSIGEALHLSTDQDVVELDEEDDNDYEKTAARLAKRSLEDFKSRPFDKASIAVGDVLAVVKDSGHVSKWKSQKTQWSDIDECWFAYVQSIEVKRGQKAFRILWMYRPADTSCALMKYPFQDELFLSAHCECELRQNWLTEDLVICRVSIAWGGNHGCKEDFFVRQRFHQHHMSFTTLKESDKKCEHLSFKSMPAEIVQRDYEVGSTVLIQLKKWKEGRQQSLQPCEIVSFNEDESLTVKRLLRRCEVQPLSNAKLNELVYTDQILVVPADRVHHECQVRFYSKQQIQEKDVPPPYSLNGSCDFFYISTRLVEDFLFGSGQRFEEIDPANPPPSLIQGFDPKAPPPKNPMRGLDLFCGGGNMGRGLEDGQAVRFTHACDCQDNAIASYYANTEDVEHTKFFPGSVNDLLKKALKGNPDNTTGVPLPGDIEFISAGSPCQGFSNMNPLKQKDDALRNQSMVANVASMVEFYRPKYAVLENVVAMAKKGEKRREDCLSQLICCLVGMGYQLQVNLLDAWSFGCPQRRTRLFVVVAAPDLAMPKHPHLSHSHPDNVNNASLGMMANGLPFGQRAWEETAFNWQSAEEATADLPDIGDGQAYHCTPFPDHRLSFNMKALLRKQLAVVPLYPPGMNAAKVWPKLSKDERELYSTFDRKTGEMLARPPEKLVNSFGRVTAKKFFPTITTACAPTERFNGRVGHWSQQRVISILEAKRAQGFLDTDVLVGTRKEQYKIVGNSVARPVAIGQGMALRKAWLQNEDDNPSLDAALVPITVRDDVAQLDLPSAPSSKGSELAYSGARRGLSSNSEMDEDSSLSSAPQRRRQSHFAVEIPATKSIVRFGSSPLPARRGEESAEQAARYVRRSTSPLSALPKTSARPGAEPAIAPKVFEAQPLESADSVMDDAVPSENEWQGFKELPHIHPGLVQTKRSTKKRRRMMGGATPSESRAVSEIPAPAAVQNLSREDRSIVAQSQQFAHLGRRRSQGLSGTSTPVAQQSRIGTPASRPSSRPPSRMSQKPIEVPLIRNDASTVQGSQLYAHLGRRRSQGPSGSATPVLQPSRLATPASRPSSRPPSRMAQHMAEVSLSRADASIAQAAAQMAGIGRRRSQTASQQVSRAVTPRRSKEEDGDDEPPRTAKRRKLPDHAILPGSADEPITFDDSDGDVAVPPAPRNTFQSVIIQTPIGRGRTRAPRARTRTPAPKVKAPTPPSIFNNPDLDFDQLSAVRKETPAPALPKTAGWTAVNTPQPQSANTIMAQLPFLNPIGASPTPAARSRGATPRQPRPKKAKKPKQPFVIDLTADSDDESGGVSREGTGSRQITPYVPVDNSAWVGMMFTKSRNGGLEGVVDEEGLLGMNVQMDMSGVDEARRLEGGGAVAGADVQQSVEVVYGY